jgi:hypothetical protein
MSFVNPLFLLGALAVAVPILLHLVKRERSLKMEFPTLMYLRQISKKSIRFQKLRHLLLLLLRVLAILLLAMAFTRPFQEVPQAAAMAGRVAEAHILLLDNSLSMAYDSRWNQALAAAEDVIGSLQPGDRAALLEFSEITLARTQLLADPAALRSELEKMKLTDRPTRYGQALKVAEKIAFDSGAGKRIIHLISDFQKTGWAAEEQNFRLGGGVELRHVDVGSDDFSNLALGDVRIVEGDEEGNEGPRIRFSLVNFGSLDREGSEVTLSLDGERLLDKTIDIEQGQVQGVEFALPRLTDGTHEIVLEVGDDRLDRDNRFALTLAARGKTSVLSIERPRSGRSGRSPSYFLARALNVASMSPYRLSTLTPQEVQSSGVIAGGLLVWNNSPGGTAAVQGRLQRYVTSGGGLIIVLGDTEAASDFNRTFGQWLPVRMERIGESATKRPSDDFTLLTDIRLDHPVFRPFGEPHSGNFSSAKFYRHVRLNAGEGSEVLARFDNGDPALVSIALDRGRVLIFTSSADDSSNDLPLKAVYAPLWQQMLRYIEDLRQERGWIEVGDTIAPRKLLAEAAIRQGKPSVTADQPLVVMDPAGARIPVAAGTEVVRTDQAGFYEVRAAGLSHRMAVNPVPIESDLTRGNAEEMVAGWLASEASAVPVIAPDERMTPEEQDNRHRFWRYLLLGALVFFLAEGWLGNQTVADQE